MKVIYVTSSLDKEEYSRFQQAWRVSLNPSLQNYHLRLIELISQICDVEVLSLRPFSLTNCRLHKLNAFERTIDNVRYHYLDVARNKYLRKSSYRKQSYRILKNLDLTDSIVLVDVINLFALDTANMIKDRFKLPVIGVSTTSPSNIPGTKKAYTLEILKNTSKYDGFITTTDELQAVFNDGTKPSLTLETPLKDPTSITGSKYKNYLFYGGNLSRRYGVYNLIEAFKQIDNPKVNLLLCGHHADGKDIKDKIKGDKRIQYLGLLSPSETYALEVKALANINAVPVNEDLDRFYFPTKVIEYLSSARPIISSKNSKLIKLFQEEIIWCKSNSVDELKLGIERLLSLTNDEKRILGEKAYLKANQLYSKEVLVKKLNLFLKKFF